MSYYILRPGFNLSIVSMLSGYGIVFFGENSAPNVGSILGENASLLLGQLDKVAFLSNDGKIRFLEYLNPKGLNETTCI